MLVGLLLLLPPSSAGADEPPAVPEANFATQLTETVPCAPKPGNGYEAQQHADEGWAGPRYGDDCRRLRFVFGPIHTKPGQNDVLIEPVTIQKPLFDGYVVRFEPNLIDATGRVPGVHQIHLHHAVWLNLTNNYGTGMNPFFATGEEKTIMALPKGYGFPVRATDTWQILYMVHNQFPQPQELFITYELDVVPMSSDAAQDIEPAYPVWLDVRPSIYPVFNAKRGFGATPGECTWPDENCADHDPWGRETYNQGCTNPATCPPPQNSVKLPAPGGSFGRIQGFDGGTLVHIAGHLHPGGKTVDVSLERGSDEAPVFSSEAVYWNHQDHTSRDGPPTSWDMSMTAGMLPRWGVRVEPNDTLRISATYDVELQSTYENMGIAVAWLAPGDTSGLNPFTAPVDDSSQCSSGGIPKLCLKGEVTHGHLEEAGVYGGANVVGLPANLGPATSEVAIAAFSYYPGGHGTLATTGIPTIAAGENSRLRFTNFDAPADIYHSVTSCAYPCTGTPGIAYPLSDGESSEGAQVDFDSGELGFGVPNLGPAKNQATWSLPITEEDFDTGIYTYFCRVHPFMRGAFAVEGAS